ncbi:MAG: STAS domain-containing protein [Armatimonadota bacterium]|nr:STAS domain-containing protein [Armatimonadota bacterium]
MNLTVSIDRGEKTTVVQLEGELDAHSSPEVRETVARLIEQGSRDLVLDLQRVEFVDSVGLGTLVGCLKRTAEHGGSFRLVCANPQITKVFEITGLSKIFHIYPGLEEALRHTPAPTLGNP